MSDAQWTIGNDTAPSGCLACNREAVEKHLQSLGVSTDTFKLLSEPQPQGSNVVQCQSCGRCWEWHPAMCV